jgi:Tol biopolymer transport system component
VAKRLLVCALLLLASVMIDLTPARSAFPGSNGAIAFRQRSRIWILHPDGTREKLPGKESSYPAWSPDGSRIAYTQFLRSGSEIWTMRADGSDRTQVTDSRFAEFAPAWSPDGSRLVFSTDRGRGADIDLFTISSTAPFGRPTALTDTPEDELNPVWSPDGTRIAFDVSFCPPSGPCGARLAVVDADGSGYSPLTSQTDGRRDVEPDWSPDSTTLLFSSDRHASVAMSDDFDVYSVPASGGSPTRITTGAGETTNASPAWSPDGTRFVYEHANAPFGHTSLRTALSDGSSIVRLGAVPGSANFLLVRPDWQPLP